jgi:hypothetical protein
MSKKNKLVKACRLEKKLKFRAEAAATLIPDEERARPA